METSQQIGFTLLETLIVIVVLVVLVSIAVPSYQTTVRNNCAVSAVNSLLSMLTLAKSESQRRGRSVAVCPSNAAGNGCNASGAEWAGGVLAYVDGNKNNAIDAGEELIRAITPLSTCSSISSTVGNFITFDSLAKPTPNTGSFTATPKSQTAISRRLVVSLPSKLRVCNPAVTGSC